jgi:hypothetical protein
MFHENWSTGSEVERWDIQDTRQQHSGLVSLHHSFKKEKEVKKIVKQTRI